jgi:hypothetical protein
VWPPRRGSIPRQSPRPSAHETGCAEQRCRPA